MDHIILYCHNFTTNIRKKLEKEGWAKGKVLNKMEMTTTGYVVAFYSARQA